MAKILIMPKTIQQFNLPCDGLLIGIKNFSINMPNYLEISDLKKTNKEIFIVLNKNIHTKDLDELKKILIELNNYSIKAVLFYDLAIVNLKESLNLNYDLVWAQEHLTTNYLTSNFWFDLGVNYTLVSNDISLREIEEMLPNMRAKTLLNVFGYLPIFASKRHLVKNYLKTFDLDDDSKVNYLEKEAQIYPIVDNNDGTVVYSSFILDGLKETLNLKVDYFILNSFLIDDTMFEKVLEIFQTTTTTNYPEKQNQLNAMFTNLGKGFFYQETIYKVK